MFYLFISTQTDAMVQIYSGEINDVGAVYFYSIKNKIERAGA